jgi:hypothetical protein
MPKCAAVDQGTQDFADAADLQAEFFETNYTTSLDGLSDLDKRRIRDAPHCVRVHPDTPGLLLPDVHREWRDHAIANDGEKAYVGNSHRTSRALRERGTIVKKSSRAGKTICVGLRRKTKADYDREQIEADAAENKRREAEAIDEDSRALARADAERDEELAESEHRRYESLTAEERDKEERDKAYRESIAHM